MFPNSTDKKIAEMTLDFFNEILAEFNPITDRSPGVAVDAVELELHEVSQMIKSSKKTKSRVEGDIFPELVGPNADILAIPLTKLYNVMLKKRTWPTLWKV